MEKFGGEKIPQAAGSEDLKSEFDAAQKLKEGAEIGDDEEEEKNQSADKLLEDSELKDKLDLI